MKQYASEAAPRSPLENHSSCVCRVCEKACSSMSSCLQQPYTYTCNHRVHMYTWIKACADLHIRSSVHLRSFFSVNVLKPRFKFRIPDLSLGGLGFGIVCGFMGFRNPDFTVEADPNASNSPPPISSRPSARCTASGMASARVGSSGAGGACFG